ncbi:MAG: OmpH family outer membrane protein [Saprospiraceae bacterium]
MKHFLFALSLLIVSFSLSAQKFGFINSQELMSNLADVKLAENSLNSFQNELVIKRDDMVKKFEVEYSAYMTEANSGTLSKVQMQQKEESLIAKRDQIQQYETTMQEQLGAKREELYKPILDKVKNVIEMVGKEGGYTMIFDTSAGALLHAAESDNLMETIKAKL